MLSRTRKHPFLPTFLTISSAVFLSTGLYQGCPLHHGCCLAPESIHGGVDSPL